MLNSGEAKIFNFSRTGSLRDATLDCIRIGCEVGNPDRFQLMMSAYIAFMNIAMLYIFLRYCPADI